MHFYGSKHFSSITKVCRQEIQTGWKTHLEVVWSPLSSSMTASKTLWAKFNVEKQEFLLKLVILTIAAILGENNFKPAFFRLLTDKIIVIIIFSIFCEAVFSASVWSDDPWIWSLFQLSNNEIFGWRRILSVSQLVWWQSLVSFRKNHWWNYLSWIDGDICYILSYSQFFPYLHWSEKCVCVFGTIFFFFDHFGDLQTYHRIIFQRSR